MSVELARVYVAVCDGCNRELGQTSSRGITFETERAALQAARLSGWTVHPDGTMYCTRGHQ